MDRRRRSESPENHRKRSRSRTPQSSRSSSSSSSSSSDESSTTTSTRSSRSSRRSREGVAPPLQPVIPSANMGRGAYWNWIFSTTDFSAPLGSSIMHTPISPRQRTVSEGSAQQQNRDRERRSRSRTPIQLPDLSMGGMPFSGMHSPASSPLPQMQVQGGEEALPQDLTNISPFYAPDFGQNLSNLFEPLSPAKSSTKTLVPDTQGLSPLDLSNLTPYVAEETDLADDLTHIGDLFDPSSTLKSSSTTQVADTRGLSPIDFSNLTPFVDRDTNLPDDLSQLGTDLFNPIADQSQLTFGDIDVSQYFNLGVGSSPSQQIATDVLPTNVLPSHTLPIASPSTSSQVTQPLPTLGGGANQDLLGKGIDGEDIHFLATKTPTTYYLTRSLSVGAYGAVFAGRRLPDGTECAIKVLKPGLKFSTTYSNQKELFIVRRLIRYPHNYVLQFLDAFETPNHRVFIGSELSPMGDLFALIYRRNANSQPIWKSMQENATKYLIRCIANGVSHLHRVGIAHGDIKPENILLFGALDYDNITGLVPKLCDFSNSRCRSSGDPPDKIFYTGRSCTLNYSAPECGTGIACPSFDMIIADVYSIGGVLLALLLSCTPFDPKMTDYPGQKYEDVCHNLKSDTVYVRTMVNGYNCSQELKQLLIKVLTPSPAHRLVLHRFLMDQWFFHQ